MHQEAVKLAAEIYARLAVAMAIDTHDEPPRREPVFEGDNLTEHDLRPLAKYALEAARVFAEAYSDSLRT